MHPEPLSQAVVSDASGPLVSPGLWIAVLWYAIEASRGVSRWLTALGYEVAASDVAEGSPIDRAVFTGLLVLALLVLIARRTRWSAILNNNRFLCLLFLYMLVSILWSDYPDISFRRWTRSLVDLAMALLVVTDRNPLEAECTLLRRVMFINIPLSIYLIKYVAKVGRSYANDFGYEMWIGTTTHKNVLGEVAMTAAIYFLFEIIRNFKTWKMWVYVPFLLMTGWILRGSPDTRSATSVTLVLLGASLLASLYFLRGKMHRIAGYSIGGVIAAMVLVLGVLLFQVGTEQSVMEVSIEGSGRDLTLTGRTDLWKDVWRIASDHPLVGVGFGSFWVGNTHHLWDTHFWHPTQGHNGYLDVYVELGFVGVVLLAGTIMASLVGAAKLLVTRFDLGLLHLVWLILIIIHNVTESSFLRGSMDLWFLFLVSAITAPAVLARQREVAPAHPRGAVRKTGSSRARPFPVPVRLRSH